MAIRFNSSPNKPERHLTPSPNKSQAKAGCWTRNAKWRAAHPDAYRTYMREYMNKRRKG